MKLCLALVAFLLAGPALGQRLGLTHIVASGSSPIVDQDGGIAEDTTDEQLILGANGRVIGQPLKGDSLVIRNLAAADDDMPFPVRPGDAITLVSAFCWCQGTCSTPATISFEVREVGTASTVTDITGSVTCQAYSSSHSPTTLTGSVTAGDVLRFDVDNAVSPETDTYSICIKYRLDRT